MSLLNIQDKISKTTDNNEYSIGLFVDLSKAFDPLDHDTLFKMLETYGIKERAIASLVSKSSE